VVSLHLAGFAAFLRHFGAGAESKDCFNRLVVLVRLCAVKLSVLGKELMTAVGAMQIDPGVMKQTFSIDLSAQVLETHLLRASSVLLYQFTISSGGWRQITGCKGFK
jgi:hypothetical protein